jgi:hypothetical protein
MMFGQGTLILDFFFLSYLLDICMGSVPVKVDANVTTLLSFQATTHKSTPAI